mgnify:CR=1 FL=1
MLQYFWDAADMWTIVSYIDGRPVIGMQGQPSGVFVIDSSASGCKQGRWPTMLLRSRSAIFHNTILSILVNNLSQKFYHRL